MAYTTLFPTNRLRHIVGRNGSHINWVQKRDGVKLDVVHHPSDEYRMQGGGIIYECQENPVAIAVPHHSMKSCKPFNAYRGAAKAAVHMFGHAYMKEVEEVEKRGENAEVALMFAITSEQGSHVVGKFGRRIRALQNKWSLYIRISPLEKDMDERSHPERLLLVNGPKNLVIKYLPRLMELLAEA